MLATTSMGTPSAVIAGRLAASRRLLGVLALPVGLVAVVLDDAWGRGRSTTTPSVPSTTIVVPSGTVSTSRPAPTTAGIPRARARMAPCETGLPAAVTMPSTVVGSSRAAWVGVRSAATTMPASTSVGSAARPSRCARTWSPTARTSSARDRRYGSASRAKRPASASTADRQACSAPTELARDQLERGADELVVVEEEQVGVEDLGLVLAGGARDVVSRRS